MYADSLRLLGFSNFLKYAVLKRVKGDAVGARIFYVSSVVKRHCNPDFRLGYWASGSGYIVSFEAGDYRVSSFTSWRELHRVVEYFPNSLLELFCEEVYKHERAVT